MLIYPFFSRQCPANYGSLVSKANGLVLLDDALEDLNANCVAELLLQAKNKNIELDVELYPNPIDSYQSEFIIKSDYSIKSCDIFDIHGRIINSINSDDKSSLLFKIKINRSIMNSGIYFANVHLNIGKSIQKLIILN